MFHAVSDQLFRTEGKDISHVQLRNRAVDFLRDNPYNDNGDHLSAFVPNQNWEGYLDAMSRDGTWGDHIVLQAMADMFGHDVSIVSSVEAENYVTILTPCTGTAARKEPPLLLGHYAENHYASLDCSPQPSFSQLKRKGEDGEEFPVEKKPAPCREEGLPVGDARKYFYFIKEKVSSDWKDLAFHLGFEQSDIDNIDGRNRDDKSRRMDLLEEWLKRNGERATIEVLMEALSEANLQSVVDGLRKEFLEVAGPVGAAGTDSSLTDVFQKSVKKYYELKLTHFKPLIWNDEYTLNLSDIFTQLELVQKQKKHYKILEKDNTINRSESMRKEERKELKSLDDLFNPDVTRLSTAPRCILIEGEAGGGKTTFLSKETLDAVSQKTELGRRHDIVLLIRLREVREGETIEEMVWDQCVPETAEGIDVLSIREILQMNESRVLFLLDGYDELRPEARAAGQTIPKLLSGKMYPNSTIVITSRPSAGVQQHTRPDYQVHIMGFSPEHMVKYVQEYFVMTKHPELAKTLIMQYFIVTKEIRYLRRLGTAVFLKDQELLCNLFQIPMFLMLLCLLWEEDQEMVSTLTMTGLYENLLTCLVRKYCEREGVDMPTEGLPVEVTESLLQLGKLALEALLRNETLLDLTEVEREKVNWKLLLKLGVVSLEVSSSRLHPRKQLNFSHKTMQEFLARRYVDYAQVNIVELLQLTSITKVFELSNLLQFTCGCDSRAAQAVMEELSKLSNREFTHLRPEQFECSQVPMDQDMQKFCKTYERFASLCLTILSERQEPEVLQGISQALPIVMLDGSTNSREATALKYYIQNLRAANLPDRLIIKIRGGTDSRDTVQYLQQCFTTSLPGLKLDLKLSGRFDSPNQTARLVSGLKYVPCLRALELSCVDLTPSSLQQLVEGFSHMSLLEELDLAGNRDLGDAGMEVLQIGLSSVPHLAVLCLGGPWLGVGMRAVGMSSLAPYMGHLVGLTELNISSNLIGDTGLESLIAVLPIFTAMQVLVLFNTSISPTSMRKLVPALCQLTRLIKLDISHNAIGDPGLECLAAILHHLTAMKVLNLRYTGVTDEGISSLIKALPYLVQLQVLDVRGSHIGDSGIVSLVQTLCQPSSLDMKQNPGDNSLTTAPHYNNTLQELDIGRNSGVTGAGLGRVTQLISALPALTTLNMSGHWDTPVHLPDTAAMALAEALPRLPAFKWLDLDYIPMEPAGFQAVVQAAEEHPTLERLHYSRDLVPEGADTTASCLMLF
ncbi:NACHT, LRR and PYD domains-containing protein 3-like [Branchiostoma lanceolatum]|uniref:NACHT, LRR and PYD domains-containing protein 3-like n=1 Tax=Branchiostoma lanceolatum TaxID=7740 RepID=UPI003451ADB0